ncbi:hypothetical protein P7K49_009302 [Saguinus oedipus]|uniref:Uncharacterized protein n=1 Tax=Saguinus oedipus TaxID=9490 RepID=A0ABQ9VJJ8_SAGOE|nr:hypothetical protein P7K49_009302 [Saguinus oedipus]
MALPSVAQVSGMAVRDLLSCSCSRAQAAPGDCLCCSWNEVHYGGRTHPPATCHLTEEPLLFPGLAPQSQTLGLGPQVKMTRAHRVDVKFQVNGIHRQQETQSPSQTAVPDELPRGTGQQLCKPFWDCAEPREPSVTKQYSNLPSTETDSWNTRVAGHNAMTAPPAANPV